MVGEPEEYSGERLTEALNKQDLSSMDDLMAPDYVDHTYQSQSREVAKQTFTLLFEGFPDFYTAIEDIIAEGDKVWVRTTVTGTHKGEYRGVPPTDEKITIKAVDIWRIVDGKIVEAWAVDDLLDFYKKLGIRVT